MSSESASIGLLPRRHALSDGTECAVPIRYFDNQRLVATLPTELGRAGQLLEGTGLQALPRDDRRCYPPDGPSDHDHEQPTSGRLTALR